MRAAAKTTMIEETHRKGYRIFFLGVEEVWENGECGRWDSRYLSRLSVHKHLMPPLRYIHCLLAQIPRNCSAGKEKTVRTTVKCTVISRRTDLISIT